MAVTLALALAVLLAAASPGTEASKTPAEWVETLRATNARCLALETKLAEARGEARDALVEELARCAARAKTAIEKVQETWGARWREPLRDEQGRLPGGFLEDTESRLAKTRDRLADQQAAVRRAQKKIEKLQESGASETTVTEATEALAEARSLAGITEAQVAALEENLAEERAAYERTVGEYLAILGDPRRDEGRRVWAARMLARLREPRAARAILAAWPGIQSGPMRLFLVESLGDLRDAKAVPPLERLVEEGPAPLAEAAREALAKIRAATARTSPTRPAPPPS